MGFFTPSAAGSTRPGFVRPSPVRTGRLRGWLLGGLLLLGGVQAQPQPSAAQSLFDQVNALLLENYGGLSVVDRPALKSEYQQRLNLVCAATPDTCPVEKAYPVIESEVTALQDEHSFFMTPDDFKEFVTTATGGNRNQFGVKLAPLNGENRVVIEVIPGSAAAEAGLQRGDLLLTLNGQSYKYTALRSAREQGIPITLGVTRQGQSLSVTMTARESSTRDLPRLSFVQAADGAANPVAVLRIPSFLAGGGVAQAVHNLVSQAQARGAQGLIVDLRDNPGGSLSECDLSMSAFVPSLARLARSADGVSRTVVSRGTRLEDGQLAGAVRNPNLWTGPLAVLVNQSSASCSEFFAYEMQYAHRGPVLGEATAGVSNTATRVFPLGNTALQLTVLNYVKPDGTPYPIQITPDVLQDQGEDSVRQLTQGVDTLLDAGVKALITAPMLSIDPFKQLP